MLDKIKIVIVDPLGRSISPTLYIENNRVDEDSRFIDHIEDLLRTLYCIRLDELESFEDKIRNWDFIEFPLYHNNMLMLSVIERS